MLVPAQVIAIRRLAAKGEQQIYEEVGARNVNQVELVLAGKTYKQVS